MKRRKEKLVLVLRVEPAYGAGPRYLIAVAGKMIVRLPINQGVPKHSAIEIMRRELAKRIYDLLDQITADL